MVRMSDLAGVAHNIAHHSASGLSYLSPHLALALRSVGLETTEIDLLSSEPYPPKAAELQPLRLALKSLQSMLITLLEKHGFSRDDVVSVVLYATPVPWDKKGYTLHTRAIIYAKDGHTFDSKWL